MKRLTIGQLAAESGVTRRTIRYYVELGLLPPPEGGGRSALYTEEHLDRLNSIRELQSARLSLDEIRDHLSLGRRRAEPAGPLPSPPAELRLGEPTSALDYLATLRGIDARPASSRRGPPPAGIDDYVGEPWTRIPIAPDVEIHVRRRGSRIDRRLARLIKEARRIMQEEEPE